MKPHGRVVAEVEQELAAVGDRLRRDRPGRVSPEHLEELRRLRNRMMLLVLASAAAAAWALLAGAAHRLFPSSRGDAAPDRRRRPA